MPELPEVETVRRLIEPVLKGRRIESARFHAKRLRYDLPVRRLLALSRSGPVREVARHGKYMLFRFPKGDWVVHLGMSGNFHRSPVDSKHMHVELHTKAGSLFYTDPRRFGFFDAAPAGKPNPHLAGKGPDALLDCPDGEGLYERSRRLKSNVKAFVLNQDVLSGVGNIYASEILFLAGVSPRRAAGRLTHAHCDALAAAIPAILAGAVERCGTTFDSFRTPEGREGDNYQFLSVYEREGQACKTCKTPIRRFTQSNRSTYYCPSCQK